MKLEQIIMKITDRFIHEVFTKPNQDFWSHLKIEGNSRIIFSGMYGTGKSTFLNHFFRSEVKRRFYRGTKQFEVFHLYPVNYSLSNNEDVFKYIKVDILNQILKNYPHLVNSTNFSFSTIASYMIAHKMSNLLPSFFTLFGQIGETNFLSDMGVNESVTKTAGVFQPLYNLLMNFKDRYAEIEQSPNELKKIEGFLNEVTQAEGSQYEMNFITGLIIDLVKRIKDEAIQREERREQSPNYKPDEIETVLIIDDLDRLDPNHVFRLFNIFGAHMNEREYLQNKFGFDKIIFVCDLINIRDLYKHSYGSSLSFNGYIDKFYSSRIFYFDNITSLKLMVSSYVRELTISTDTIDIDEVIIKRVKSNLSIILSSFLKNGSISLRSLIKLVDKPVRLSSGYIEAGNLLIYNVKPSVITEFDILFMMFHHKDDVLSALELCKQKLDFLIGLRSRKEDYLNVLYSTLPLICEKPETDIICDKSGANNLKGTYSLGEEFFTVGFDTAKKDFIINKFNSANEEIDIEYDKPAVDLYIEAFHFLSRVGYF